MSRLRTKYVLDGNGKLWRVDQATLAKGPEVAVKP